MAPVSAVAETSIGIVGAGVGGLAAALTLGHLGFGNITLYERAGKLKSPDRATEITANASRVLIALGLGDALEACSVMPGSGHVRLSSNGFLLIQRPLGNFSKSRYGAPSYLLSQRNLTQLLLDACLARGVRVEFNANVVEVESANGRMVLENGDVFEHAALICADGANSTLGFPARATVQPREESFQVISACAAVESATSVIQTWVGKTAYCIQYPLPGNRVDLLAVSRLPPDDTASARDQLADVLSGVCKPLARVVAGVEHACVATALNVSPAEHWYAGKLALLGDACHPLPVYSAQGACAAIEDAWVLAVMMERWEESPHQGFANYQRYRLPRVTRLRDRANASAQELLLCKPLAAFTRNLKWSLTSRFLPEIAMAKLDWLYGYDCIRGFA